MESDSDVSDSDCFVDAIANVARANDTPDDVMGTAFLPEISVHSSPIYNRHHQPHKQGRHSNHSNHSNLLYSTNTHRSHGVTSPTHSAGSRHREHNLQMERALTFQRDVALGQAQTYARPVLPLEMTSHDFLTSWLQKGADTQSQLLRYPPPQTEGGERRVDRRGDKRGDRREKRGKSKQRPVSDKFTVIHGQQTPRSPEPDVTKNRKLKDRHVSE